MSKASFRASGTQQGLIENMQILTGQKGDKLDKALTLREAASLGLVNLRRNSSGNVVPEVPSNPSDPVWSGVQTPNAPVDVSADGAFHTISITWDPPTYQGHSYAEILRAETDNPAQAVPIGETSANVYSDAVGKGFEAYYWVRFVNKNGLRGPFQSSSGLHAKTSPDVDEIIASATNFAIYNPAKPTEKEIIFGVTDDGKVAILEAVIKAATIQIIHAEKITADYVKAGVSISAPVINGGSIAIGNNFAVTADGAMTAWSATLRYVTSYYGTFNYATINNATMKNCVIEKDCTVKGTIYAEKIVGDVVKPYLLELDLSKLAGGYAWLSASVTIPSESRERKLTLMQSVVQLDYDIGSTPLEVYVKLDGVTIASYVGNPVVGVNQFLMPARIITLAAGKTVTITASIFLLRAAIDQSSSFTVNPSYALFVSR